MKDTFLKLFVKMQSFQKENGQDMIEYVLLAAIVALGAVAGLSPLATQVNKTFSLITSTLTAYS
jgi:Flp pilus assembly pilin Flp